MDPNQPSSAPSVYPTQPLREAPVASVPSAAPMTANIPELPKQPEKLLPEGHKTSWGAFIGIVIIVLVLIVGALYFWGAKLAEQDAASGENAALVGGDVTGIESEMPVQGEEGIDETTIEESTDIELFQ